MISFTLIFSAMVCLFLYIGYRFKWLFSGLLLVASLCFPFLAHTEGWDWFRYAKTISVMVPIFFYSLSQAVCEQAATSFSRKLLKAMIWLVPWIYLINIGEAVVGDFFAKEFLNSIAGVLLILTIPNFWGKWYYNRSCLLGFGSFPDWCIVYTLWNAHFVQTYTKGEIQLSFAFYLILLLCLLICLICKDWHLWIFCRSYSLGFVLIATSFFSGLTERLIHLMPNAYWNLNEKSLFFWSLLNLLAASFLVYRTLQDKRSCFIAFHKLGTDKR